MGLVADDPVEVLLELVVEAPAVTVVPSTTPDATPAVIKAAEAQSLGRLRIRSRVDIGDSFRLHYGPVFTGPRPMLNGAPHKPVRPAWESSPNPCTFLGSRSHREKG